ncbi:MAG: hypothetical protein JSV89_07310 [Spirochaetaceae bacterium]|nr:MAG: hypothetical protein JSV89_07310 [Spirochaetaceae bacterium]
MRSRVVAALPIALALVWLSGCATMAGWVGIASSESVDEKLTGTRSELEAEIGSLRSDLDAHQTRVTEIESLSRSMEEAIRATEELQQLADVMESRLEQMPRDTIQELVDILQRYLDDSE